jgi:hypothetical protein
MKDEKKPGGRAVFRIGFCLFLVVIFMTVSVPTAAQETPLCAGDSRLFGHYGDDNGLFSQCYRSGMGRMSNQAQINDKPRVSTGKIIGEILLGMVGNVAGGYAGALIGYQVSKKDDDEWFDGFGGGILGYFSGSTFGSAFGVYLIGNTGNTNGSFGRALLGGLLGEVAAVAVSIAFRDETVTQISFVTLPPIGAALLLNSSLRYKSSPESNALLNFNHGKVKIGIPYFHIQPLPSYAKNVKPTVRLNVNLLNIAL